MPKAQSCKVLCHVRVQPSGAPHALRGTSARSRFLLCSLAEVPRAWDEELLSSQAPEPVRHAQP